MREPQDFVYTMPPTSDKVSKLHYVLVKMSSRTYCVAEFNGIVPIPPSDVFPSSTLEGHACQVLQGGFEFEIVSKPMNFQDATDHLMYLLAKRIKERPIILE